jgi:hypothetical protein
MQNHKEKRKTTSREIQEVERKIQKEEKFLTKRTRKFEEKITKSYQKAIIDEDKVVC